MRAAGDSEEGIGHIYHAIQQVSSNTGVDNRVILSIIMQESHGKITTNNAGDGQNTPGLMQAMGCPNHAGEEDVSRVCTHQQWNFSTSEHFSILCERVAVSSRCRKTNKLTPGTNFL